MRSRLTSARIVQASIVQSLEIMQQREESPARPTEEVPPLGTVLVGRYELVAEIGRGGCAVVFEAQDLRLDRVVAVKLPIGIASDHAKMSRFARESRVIASIHHPNVCAVLDTGMTEDDVPFLVMERLFGESLRAGINRAGYLPVGEALAIGLQLLSALDAVHAAGIVHRDVKPDNIILVTRGGCDPLVKLLDFGLCRPSSRRQPGARSSQEETMTCEGAIIGTPEYMAPEQVMGSTSLDVRVDIYAVGVVLYEALSGDRAFFSKNLRDILSGVMTKQIRPLRQIRRDVPASLEAIIARAMDRRPDARHQSALELQDNLLAVKEELAAMLRAERRKAQNQAVPDRSGAYHAASGARVDVDPDEELTDTSWELPTTRFQRQAPMPIPRRPLTPPTAPRRQQPSSPDPQRQPSRPPPLPNNRFSRTG